MKTIYLMRHAQATEPGGSHEDKSRELTELGVEQTQSSAAFLQKKQIALQKIIYSDATRTTLTAKTLAQVLGAESLLMPTAELYNASVDRWLRVLRHIEDNSLNKVLFVGHNLGISRLACYLTDEDLPDMDTGAVYALQLSIDKWSDIDSGIAHLEWMFVP